MAVRCVEPLRRKVACSSTGRIEEERKVRGVVEREVRGLVGCKVGEVDPVPGGDEDVLGFDVAVRDLAGARVAEGGQHLVRDPLLLDRGEEGAGAGERW